MPLSDLLGILERYRGAYPAGTVEHVAAVGPSMLVWRELTCLSMAHVAGHEDTRDCDARFQR
jgi:hypothetical protein